MWWDFTSIRPTKRWCVRGREKPSPGAGADPSRCCRRGWATWKG
jgi:hypothetical protein